MLVSGVTCGCNTDVISIRCDCHVGNATSCTAGFLLCSSANNPEMQSLSGRGTLISDTEAAKECTSPCKEGVCGHYRLP